MYTQKLTDYQKEILHLNRSGMTQKEISKKLGSSQQSVSSAVQSIKKKGYEIMRHYRMVRKIPNPSTAETPKKENVPQEPEKVPKVEVEQQPVKKVPLYEFRS